MSSRRTLDNNNANAAQMCKERLADTNGVDSVVCVCVFPIINLTFADRISRYYIISTVENMFQEYSDTHIMIFWYLWRLSGIFCHRAYIDIWTIGQCILNTDSKAMLLSEFKRDKRIIVGAVVSKTLFNLICAVVCA